MRMRVKNIPAIRAALLAFLLHGALPDAGSAACAIGGTSALSPPATTHLRSYRASFGTPSRLAVDAAGNVYVADPGRRQVVVRAANGHVLRRAGDLGRPLSIAVAVDRIYVGDEESGSVRVLRPAARQVLVADQLNPWPTTPSASTRVAAL